MAASNSHNDPYLPGSSASAGGTSGDAGANSKPDSATASPAGGESTPSSLTAPSPSAGVPSRFTLASHPRAAGHSSFKMGTSGSPGSPADTPGSNSGGAKSPLPKQKGPQKVRFPLYNNPETKRIHLPSDESSREAQSDTYSRPSSPGAASGSGHHTSYFAVPTSSQRKQASSGTLRRSPLVTPPINIDFADGHTSTLKEEDEDEEYSDGYDSRPSLSRNESSQELLRHHHNDEYFDSNADIGASPRVRSLLGHGEDARSAMFDIGLITSGGLAPGAGLSDQDSRAQPNQRDQFQSRRFAHSTADNDPEALATSLNTQYNSVSGLDTGPYGNGMNEGDVPLLELHRRLKEVAQQQKPNGTEDKSSPPENERDDVDEAAKKFALGLVRAHSRFLRSRPPSPGGDDNYMTVPSRAFWDNDGDENTTLLDAEGANITKSKSAEEREADEARARDEEENREILADGTITPVHEDYVPPPAQVREGVLGSLLKLYGQRQQMESNTPSLPHSSAPSGASTPQPRKSFGDDSFVGRPDKEPLASRARNLWHKSKSANASTSSLSELISSSNRMLRVPGGDTPPKELGGGGGSGSSGGSSGSNGKPTRPKLPKRHSAMEVLRAKKEKKRKAAMEREAWIAEHIADVLHRQRFILRLCRALMLFGAPTHRLEEYMKMTSRVLSIDGQFLYIPGCMICSFGDSSTHTSEMQLVRCVQGVNLYKLHQTHQVYKEVIHAQATVDEASKRIEELLTSKNLYSPWMCVIFFGLASVAVAPFAFGGRWHDMPISFLLGSCVGILQTVVAPRSALYNNVFEVTASIVVSFLGRAFGSIGTAKDIFCFAAIAQSSLALILPGYIILCGSLELQSRNIVAGSVRMFYAIIYSLFLGFGITLGAAIYGWIDKNATSETQCPHTLDPLWRILFVPMFTVTLALVNQAHWRQIPIMIGISGTGYVVTYFSTRRLANAAELTSALGALVIGVLGNVYSRLGRGLAFAAMLPAIFVQVPSGVASQGSLVAGIDNANSIVANSSTTTTDNSMGSVANLGITMVQVSIGITVGLFVATLLIYPFGKKRSGLFTF